LKLGRGRHSIRYSRKKREVEKREKEGQSGESAARKNNSNGLIFNRASQSPLEK